MKYLVDSDWLIDGIGGDPAAVRVLDELSGDPLAVGIVSCGEVFAGAFSSPDPAHELAIFRRYLSAFVILPLSDPIMELFARVRGDLRRRGLLIPDLDLQIAATALHHDLELLTRNRRHFDRIPGLKLYEA